MSWLFLIVKMVPRIFQATRMQYVDLPFLEVYTEDCENQIVAKFNTDVILIFYSAHINKFVTHFKKIAIERDAFINIQLKLK